MATTKQKKAARKNIAKARSAQSARARGRTAPRRGTRGLSTAEQNKLPDSSFAFPKQRKEPLTDAKHVRNAVARFDQVEGVTDADRDRAAAIRRRSSQVRCRDQGPRLAAAVRRGQGPEAAVT